MITVPFGIGAPELFIQNTYSLKKRATDEKEQKIVCKNNFRIWKQISSFVSV